jgi:hypothetical protein
VAYHHEGFCVCVSLGLVSQVLHQFSNVLSQQVVSQLLAGFHFQPPPPNALACDDIICFTITNNRVHFFVLCAGVAIRLQQTSHIQLKRSFILIFARLVSIFRFKFPACLHAMLQTIKKNK